MDVQLRWRALVWPIFKAMHRAGIVELRIVRKGPQCALELIPEGYVGRDVSPPSDQSDKWEGADDVVFRVCDNCGLRAEFRALHIEAGFVHVCSDCLSAHPRDHSRVRKILPPSATG